MHGKPLKGGPSTLNRSSAFDCILLRLCGTVTVITQLLKDRLESAEVRDTYCRQSAHIGTH